MLALFLLFLPRPTPCSETRSATAERPGWLTCRRALWTNVRGLSRARREVLERLDRLHCLAPSALEAIEQQVGRAHRVSARKVEQLSQRDQSRVSLHDLRNAGPGSPKEKG